MLICRSSALESTTCQRKAIFHDHAQKERTHLEYVIASGASLHTRGRASLSFEEKKTVRQTHNPCVSTTSNGLVQGNREATVYIKDLDIFLCVRLFEDSPAVLSLGMLCEDMGCSYL